MILTVFVASVFGAGTVEAVGSIDCLTPPEERIAGVPVHFLTTVIRPEGWSVWLGGSLVDVEKQFSGAGGATIVFPAPGEYRVECYSFSLPSEDSYAEIHVTILPGEDPPAAVPPTIVTGAQTHFEDFSNAEDWSEGGDAESTYGPQIGQYVIIMRKEGWMRWARVPQTVFDLDDITMAVDVALTAESQGSGGIIWGSDDDNFYRFDVDDDGQYYCGWQSNGDWQPKRIPWTRYNTIARAPGANHLEITVRNDSIILAVNGVVLETLSGNAYSKGRVGLVVATRSDEVFCEGHFDNLSIRPAPMNVPPEAAFTLKTSDCSVTEIRAGNTVYFDASASDDSDGRIVEYSWDFDGDSAYDQTFEFKKTYYKYQEPGRYKVTL